MLEPVIRKEGDIWRQCDSSETKKEAAELQQQRKADNALPVSLRSSFFDKYVSRKPAALQRQSKRKSETSHRVCRHQDNSQFPMSSGSIETSEDFADRDDRLVEATEQERELKKATKQASRQRLDEEYEEEPHQ